MIDKKMAEKYYSIGQFARLSGTTRDTLIHYDNIGILKPAYVGENGYRYYLMIQIYKVKWIHYMQQLGLKLSDIKEYSEIEQREKFVSLLEEQAKDLEQQLMRHKMFIKILQNTVRSLKMNNIVRINEPYFEYMEEEYIVISETKLNTFQDPLQLSSLYELIRYMCDNYLWDEIYLGSIVPEKNLKKGDILTQYWYTRVSMPLQDEHMVVKPAGTYAVVDYYGSPYELVEAHNDLIGFIEEKGYKIAGDAYEADFGGYSPFDDENQCTIKIMIRVEPMM